MAKRDVLAEQRNPVVKAFADELRKWWSFDNGQHHTHSWHSREDFIERKLPELLGQVAYETTQPSEAQR